MNSGRYGGIFEAADGGGIVAKFDIHQAGFQPEIGRLASTRSMRRRGVQRLCVGLPQAKQLPILGRGGVDFFHLSQNGQFGLKIVEKKVDFRGGVLWADVAGQAADQLALMHAARTVRMLPKL